MNSSSKWFQTIVDFKYISTSVHVEEEDISMLWKIKKKDATTTITEGTAWREA